MELMAVLDQFIDVAINRLASENASMLSHFYLDLRNLEGRQRVTQKLLNDAIAICNSRGLNAIPDHMGNLQITVDLRNCRFNQYQAVSYNNALQYVRNNHGLMM